MRIRIGFHAGRRHQPSPVQRDRYRQARAGRRAAAQIELPAQQANALVDTCQPIMARRNVLRLETAAVIGHDHRRSPGVAVSSTRIRWPLACCSTLVSAS